MRAPISFWGFCTVPVPVFLNLPVLYCTVYRYCTVHSPSSRRFVSCAQPVVAPPALVCMGAGRSAPVEPAVDAKNSSSTIAFPIKLFKDSSPIGILLQGNSYEPPTIIGVSEDSPAVRARPRLAVGMRILSINGIAVHGPYEASQLLRAAVGIVELEVEGEESLVKGADIYWFPIFKIVELRKRAVSRLEERGDRFARLQKQADAGTPVAPREPTKFQVVLRNPQGANSLGLVLGGKSAEAPRIVKVTENSVVSSAEPRLLPRMRILEVNGRPAVGAGPTNTEALEVSIANGEVRLTIEDPERRVPSSAPNVSSVEAGFEAQLRARQSKRRVTSSKQRVEKKRRSSEEDFPKPAVESSAEPARVSSVEVGFEANLRLQKMKRRKSVTLSKKENKTLADAVVEALQGASACTDGMDGDDDDFMDWTLDAWLDALQPHRVLSSGLQALLQEEVQKLNRPFTPGLEYHFVTALGAMPAERAMKLLVSLISHKTVIRAIAELLLNGAGVVARAKPHTAADVVRIPTVADVTSVKHGHASDNVDRIDGKDDDPDSKHPPPPPMATIDRKLLRLVFDKFDADASGRVSTAEMSAMLKEIKLKKTPAEIAKMMTDADRDDDGEIDFEEFVAAVQKQTTSGGDFANVFINAGGFFGFLNRKTKLNEAKERVELAAKEAAIRVAQETADFAAAASAAAASSAADEAIARAERDAKEVAKRAAHEAAEFAAVAAAAAAENQKQLDRFAAERDAMNEKLAKLEAAAEAQAAQAALATQAALAKLSEEVVAAKKRAEEAVTAASQSQHEHEVSAAAAAAAAEAQYNADAAQKSRELEEQAATLKAEAEKQKQVIRKQQQELEEQMLAVQAEKERKERELKEESERKEAEAKAKLLELEKEKERERRRLAEELYKTQEQLLQANLTLNKDGVPVILDRYIENNPAGFDLKYGTLDDFRGGLKVLLGADVPPPDQVLSGMEAEHTKRLDSDAPFEVYNYGTVTTSRFEFYFVVDPSGTRLNSLGIDQWPVDTKLKAAGRPCRQANAVRSFREVRAKINTQLEEAGSSPLNLEEFCAARLYTGPLYMKYNGCLRGILPDSPQFFQIAYERLCQGNNYATTIHTINLALVKLSMLQKVQRVYRGLAGKLPKPFRVEDKYCARGGVELGFMSTTTNQHVAEEYASSAPGSLLLEIEQGLLDRGAEIAWLSEYPGEAEVCFPPLTALGVRTTKVKGALLVVSCSTSICSRPALRDKNESVPQELVRLTEMALVAVGDTVAGAVKYLTGCPATMQHTPLGNKKAFLPPVLQAGISRVALVPKETRTRDAILDVCLDINLVNAGDTKSEREAVFAQLSDVLSVATEIFDGLAHAELAITPDVEQAGADYWARLFFDRLFPIVDADMRAKVNVETVREIKRYNKPPEAVAKILTATMILLEGAPGRGALPKLNQDALSSWTGTGGLRNVLDAPAILKALSDFDLSAVTTARWKKVKNALGDVTTREAMMSSVPLAALFCWIKMQGLRAERVKTTKKEANAAADVAAAVAAKKADSEDEHVTQ